MNKAITSKITYIFAIIIIVFGSLGIIICSGSIFIIKNLNIGNLNFDTINTSVQEGTVSVNTLIKDSATALNNLSGTVTEIENTLSTSAELSRSAAKATYEIAETMNFEILDFKPLADSAKYFNNIGDNLDSLAENIEKTSVTINQNAEDIDKIAVDLKDISIEIENASENFNKTATSLPGFGFKKILYVLLLYGVFLHLMFVFTGISLITLLKSMNKTLLEK